MRRTGELFLKFVLVKSGLSLRGKFAFSLFIIEVQLYLTFG